jgi:DNA-binding GntR family transcriptional regulator
MKSIDIRFPEDIMSQSSILPPGGFPALAKLVPVNLSERAYFRIKKMISDYRFSPGSRLNVEQLARDLGTSRTPVWEAVRRLEQEGLVKNIPNRGVFLVELTRQAAIELYTVREVLEGMAARLAVQRISDKALEKMERLLRAQEKIVSEEDLVAYSKSDFEFHACIYAACGNAILREMLESIKQKVRPIAMQITPILTELFHDHEMIVRALRLRDPLLAEVVFREHNQRVLKQLNAEDLNSRIRNTNTPPKRRKP